MPISAYDVIPMLQLTSLGFSRIVFQCNQLDDQLASSILVLTFYATCSIMFLVMIFVNFILPIRCKIQDWTDWRDWRIFRIVFCNMKDEGQSSIRYYINGLCDSRTSYFNLIQINKSRFVSRLARVRDDLTFLCQIESEKFRNNFDIFKIFLFFPFLDQKEKRGLIGTINHVQPRMPL